MRKKLTHIWPYLKRYRWYLVWGVVAIAATNALALLAPLVLRSAINRTALAIAANNLLAWLNPLIPRIAVVQMKGQVTASTIDALTGAALLIVALAVGAGIFRFFTRRTIVWASRKIEYDLRGDLFSHILKLDAGFFDRTPTGDIITRASSDIEQVRQMVGPGIMQGLNTLIVAGVAIPMMAHLNARLALYVLLPLPLLAVITNVLGGIAHKRFLAIQKRFSALSASIQESLAGIRVIKTRVRESETKRQFLDDNVDYFGLNMRLIRLWGGFFPLLTVVSGSATLLVLYFGGDMVIDGEIDLGTLIAFMIYLGMLMWPMIALGWVVSLYQRGTASLRRIKGIFDVQPQVIDPPAERAQHLPSPGTLEMRHLTFSYNGNGAGLHDISLEIHPGETVAIAGPTGSGKSTIAQLFWRRYPVPNETLFFGGVDANAVLLREWRSRVAVVPQEAFLFSETLRRNIALSNSKLAQERLTEVGELAALNKDIEDFPRGYETIVGERGITLSGGQKQRATLARALVSPADVLILDDSFSAIDASTEEEILERLESIFGTRIIVLITHRISTLKRADRILFMDRGRIADSGTHTEMLERGGAYARWEAREQLRQKLEEM
jgi:ATP-binding cassette subfamily B multidrug efflux pump